MKYYLFSSLLIIVGFTACTSKASKKETTVINKDSMQNRKWWKEAVVYQIYPRSFKDSDGDGVGDLKGIISKLDYVKSLGVDVVWLNPIYDSPNDDNGYDISDYRAIMKEMGTMQDFDNLLKGMHERGLKLVMDLVVNHCSDEHKWFKEARSSRTNPYRNYFHWWPAEKGTPPKRWSFFDVNENAWKYDSLTNSYYLHYFSQKQPDLNWENPAVRKEIYSLMKFWFDKGVDGFRMDVIPFISKDTTFPPLPAEYKGDYVHYYAKGPHMHEYLQEMNREVLSKYDIMTVGEGAGVVIEDALKLVNEDRKELDMFFQFEAAHYGKSVKNSLYDDSSTRKLTYLKDVFTKWDSVFAAKGWGTVYFGNHDQSRMVSRFGNDAPAYRNASAKMLYTLLLSQRATPYVYYGDEIGMQNIRFKTIDQYQDLMTKNYYKGMQQRGATQKELDEFLRAQAEISRDNGRTPMQWDNSTNSGFTTGKPWLPVNPLYAEVNVVNAEKDPESILNYFRKMIALRKSDLALVYGKYQLLDAPNEQVYAYTRTMDKEKLLVVLNFTKENVKWNNDEFNNKPKSLLISNYKVNTAIPGFELRPFEARIYKLQ